jgi:BMFP domain-containing protein YqiC
MQSENPLIADFVKLMNSAAGTLAGMGREARDSAREHFKEAMGGMDFVSREEFDAVKDMAVRAREENEALKERLVALEAKVFGPTKNQNRRAADRPLRLPAASLTSLSCKCAPLQSSAPPPARRDRGHRAPDDRRSWHGGGLCRGSARAHLRPVLIPGNLVDAELRARSASQLPFARLELVQSRGPWLSEPLPAAAIGWVTRLPPQPCPSAKPILHFTRR